MSEPAIGGRKPILVDVEAGTTYWWCTCGRSQNQPFCDGSHAGTGFEPREYICDTTGRIAFCTCKRSDGPPLCDGSHKRLPDTGDASQAQ